MKRLFVSILLVVALLFLVSCDDTQPTLKVSQSTVDLFVGDTYDLKPTVLGLKRNLSLFIVLIKKELLKFQMVRLLRLLVEQS